MGVERSFLLSEKKGRSFVNTKMFSELQDSKWDEVSSIFLRQQSTQVVAYNKPNLIANKL
jgi:hypothetical protein